ncbi:hypothetical protein HDU81_004291 [Chytriomyces hyalinus]|nr:hypothetical protein HDU81_004291 [Chytriomyces hyalinus]
MDFKHDAVMEYAYVVDGSDTEDDGDALSFTQGDDEVWRSDSDDAGDSDDSEDFDLLNPVAFSYIEGSLMAPVHCVHVRAPANSDMLGLAFMTTQKLTEERKLKDFAIFKLITMQNALRHVYSLLETGDLDSPSSANDTMSPTDELPSQMEEEAQTTEPYEIETPRRVKPYRSKSVFVSQPRLPSSPDMTERGYSSADDAFLNIKKQSKTLIRIRQPEKFTVRKRSIPAKLVIERDAYATHVATSLKHSPKNAAIVIPARTASSSSVNFVRDVDLRPLPPVPRSPDSPPQSIMEALLDSAPVRPSTSKPVKAPSSPTSDVIGSVRRKLSAFGPSSKSRSSDEESTSSMAKPSSPTLTPPVNAIVSSTLERQMSESRDSRRYNRITPAQDVPFPSREIAKNLEMKARRITNGTLATVATTATTVSTTTSSSGADVDLNLRDSILSNSRDSTLSLSTVSSRSRRSVVDYEFAFDFDQSESVEMETVRRKSAESKKRKSKASRLSVIVTVDDEIKMEGYHHYARNRKSKLTETGGDSVGRAAPPLPQAPPLNPDGTVKIMKRTDSLSANSKAIVVENMVFDITGLESDALNVDLGQSTKQTIIPSLSQLLERPPRDSSSKPLKQEERVPTPPARTPFKELDLGRNKNLQALPSSQETTQQQQPRALGRPLPAQLFSSTSLPLNFKSDFNSSKPISTTPAALSPKPSKPHSPVPMSVTLSREVEAHLQKQLAPNSSIATGPREGPPRQGGVKPGSLSKQEQLLQQGSLPALNTFSVGRRDSSASSTSSSSSATTAGDLSRRQQPAIQARTKSLFIDMSPFESNRAAGGGGGVIRRGSDSSEMNASNSTILSPSLPPRRDSMLKKVISEPQGLNQQHTLVGGRSMSPVSASTAATRRQAIGPLHLSKVVGEPGVGMVGSGELASSQPSIPHRSSSRFVSQD